MFAPDAPGELGGDLPNPDMLRRPTMRREAQSTSALEGTFEPLETVLDNARILAHFRIPALT